MEIADNLRPIRPRLASVACHAAIEHAGGLSPAQWMVYDCVFHHGPLTRNEIDQQLATPGGTAAFSRRLVELERLGVLKRGATRKCTVTGYPCEEWDVTDELPQRQSRGLDLERAYARAYRTVAFMVATGEAEQDPLAFIARVRALTEQLSAA